MRPTMITLGQVRLILDLLEIPEAIQALCESQEANLRESAIIYQLATEASDTLIRLLPPAEQEAYLRNSPLEEVSEIGEDLDMEVSLEDSNEHRGN